MSVPAACGRRQRSLLEVNGLDIALFRRRRKILPLVNNVSLDVGQGRIHAVVGESGSGKTLMARSIVGLLPPGIRIAGGGIRFAGRDLVQADAHAMQKVRGREIGFVFQEPLLSLNPALRVGEQIAEGMRRHLRMSREEIRQASIDMLRRVSIRDPAGALRRFPHEFSGGMRQRIMLASVLALRPSLLIADEPTTALDAIIQRDVLDIMNDLVRDLGASVILITHDLGLVARYADDATVMRRGGVVEAGSAGSVIGRPQAAYTRDLLSACPTRKKRPGVAPDKPPILDVDNLVMRYRGRSSWPWRRAPEVEAVSGVSLSLRPGETLAVVGESGSGKTTLGRAIMGLRAASAGGVKVAGASVDLRNRDALRTLRRNAQIVFQDSASSLDPRYRVGALVAEGLKLIADISRDERKTRVLRALADVGLGAEFTGRYPHELSGGQRQRVAIARAAVLDPKLIVADEPVSALDVTVQAQVLDLMARIQREKGFAYLFISHDLGVVEQISDRIAVMCKGRVVEMASRDDLFDHPVHPYTRDLLSASVEVKATGGGTFAVSLRKPGPASGFEHLSFYNGAGAYALREVAPGRHVAVSPSPITGNFVGEPA